MNTRHPEFGERSGRTERFRWCGIAAIVLAVLAAEFGSGHRLEDSRVAGLEASPNWVQTLYDAPTGRLEAPQKKPGVRRILFVSNSHAATGGAIPVHLQHLLDRIEPGGFEILDLSSHGMFAPDALQRVLFGLSLQPDALLLNVAYISFSDQMPLAAQDLGAHSFFKPAVRRGLEPGFWWRNYDLSLFGETLVSSHFRFYRHRNRARDQWEKPLARALGGGDGGVRFLEVDSGPRWRIPEGYDNNLCQSRLYAAGRRNHLADLEDLVAACRLNGLPTIAVNLPVDWRKTRAEQDAADFELYRQQVAEILAGTDRYVDYQHCFPVGFSTYDALHPTRHGARLHALDLVLRLHDLHIVTTPPEQIADAFAAMEPAINQEYERALHDHSASTGGGDQANVLRYDPSDPDSASQILAALASTEVGSHTEMYLLHNLGRRITFWRDRAPAKPHCSDGFAPIWCAAASREMQNSRERAAFFAAAATRLQAGRLQGFPLPSGLGVLEPVATGKRTIKGLPVVTLTFDLNDGGSATAFNTVGGATIAIEVTPADGRPGHLRIDVFGDGGFAMMRPAGAGFLLPGWTWDTERLIRWDW